MASNMMLQGYRQEIDVGFEKVTRNIDGRIAYVILEATCKQYTLQFYSLDATTWLHTYSASLTSG